MKLQLELTHDRAAALAMFIKRSMLSECESKCGPAELKTPHQYAMQPALFDVGQALAEAGYNPCCVMDEDTPPIFFRALRSLE